jgi:uncharacterized repeat protein (TIGR01451 family)
MVLVFGRYSKPLIALVFVLATGRCLFAGKEFLAGTREQIVAGQLLVGLQPGADINQILSALVPQATASLISRERNTYMLNLPPGIQAAASHLLAAHPLVKYVEPNRIRKTTVAPPNDPSLPQQWALTTIQAVQAWSYFPDHYLTALTAGANRVKVAILDTGVDCTHPDFMNAGGTSTNSVDGGQLDWSASLALTATTISSPACPWEDDNGHGTHTAGILAAATDNATGVASLGFPLQLIVIKTNDENGDGTDDAVAEGIYDAVDAGAQVISISLGGAGYSQTMQDAMDYAWQNNALVVAAAGNETGNELTYPGDGNHMLGVAATDNTNTVAGWSNYGNGVKIAAPGVNVLSTLPTYTNGYGSNYGYLSGTSMSTPHVAALAGLLFAANPGISVAAVAQRIQQTAQSPNTGWNQYIGYGVIDAGAALAGIPGPFTEGSLTGQVTEPNGDPITGAVVTAGNQSYTTAADPDTGDINGLFRIANLSPGTYAITVSAANYSTVNIQSAVVAGADTMLTVQMGVSYGEFTGVVTYNGVGVAGAVVEAVTGGLIQGTAVTNASGSYTLSVQPGTYTLTASAPNYINTASTSQSLSANGSVTVNLALSALGNLTGMVTDLNGVGVANAHIDFTNGSFSGGAVTGAGGSYSTFGLPAGTYTVTASASGYSGVSISGVSVTANTSTLVNLRFSTGVALTNELLGYWPLNEGTGNVAHDQSGNGYNATLSNTAWTTGPFNYAVSFNGTNSHAVTPAIPFTNAFSVSVWVNPASTPQTGWAGIVQSESNSGLSLGVDSTGATYKFTVNGGAGSTGTCAFVNVAQGCAQGGTVTAGWHMVSGTYDGTTAVLYVDGVMVASDTFTAPADVSVPLQIGASWSNSAVWDGALDAVRLYSRALTASEVSALFAQAINLSLTKTADAATAAAGGSIGYTLAVTNSGAGTSTSAALSDVLPAGTGIGWSISPAYSGTGTCAIANGTLSCSFGNLSSGATASVHVTSATTASSCGVYQNTASASAANARLVQASATTTVQCGQTITFGTLSSQPYSTAPFTVSATASSGLTVSFASTTSSVCTVSGSSVTFVTVGTCTIQATQAGNAVYSSAAPVNQSFTVTQGSQTITFGALSNQALGTAPFPVSATASSGLTVSFASTTSSVCTVSGSSVTFVAIGTCTIQATQAGNAVYFAATPVNQSFTVTAGLASPGTGSLSFPNTIVGQSSAARTVTLQNSGNTALTIASIAPAGTDAANYRYTADAVHPCPISPATLGAGAACTLDVTFVPASPGAHNNAQIAIVDNSGNVAGATQTIGLAGTGIVLSSITVSASSASLAYNTTEQFTAIGTYSDNSTAILTSQAAWSSSAASVATIGVGGLATAVAGGQTNITAAQSGVTSNNFQLTVLPGTAAVISISGGSGQSAAVGTAFAGPLQALVKNSGGNAVPNASVTFTAPSSGASATFANGLASYTTATNSSGIATSLTLTANATAGSYSVTAAVAGVTATASFSLTNLKGPFLTITETPVGAFIQGQSAVYAVTVGNAAGEAPTSGTVTVTEAVPAGLALLGMSGGATWNCSLAGSCTTNAVLNAGSTYPSITVTLSLPYNVPPLVANEIGVSGGGSAAAIATDPTPVVSACDVTLGNTASVADVQKMIDEALGLAQAANDLNGDREVNVLDVQIVMNAVMNLGCSAS